jgi:hypothetical protein
MKRIIADPNTEVLIFTNRTFDQYALATFAHLHPSATSTHNPCPLEPRVRIILYTYTRFRVIHDIAIFKCAESGIVYIDPAILSIVDSATDEFWVAVAGHDNSRMQIKWVFSRSGDGRLLS